MRRIRARGRARALARCAIGVCGVVVAHFGDDLRDGSVLLYASTIAMPRGSPRRVDHNRLGHATGIGGLEQFLDCRPVAGHERIDRSNG